MYKNRWGVYNKMRVGDEENMQISEVAQKFGLTQDTLRYYEREGLIGPIAKGDNGIRNYTENDLQRIQFVKCMRAAGLEISFLKKYIQLFDEGDETIKERREILVEQRKILKKKLDDMQEAYDRLNMKIDLYDKNILDKSLMKSFGIALNPK